MYCKFCGIEIKDKVLQPTKSIKGFTCDQCFDHYNRNGIKRPTTQYCVECGEELIPEVITPANRVTYLRFGNRKTCKKCSGVIQDEAPKIEIIYECRCKIDRKVKHHFDYRKPFLVLLLCSSCHLIEHSRINNLNIDTHKEEAPEGFRAILANQHTCRTIAMS